MPRVSRRVAADLWLILRILLFIMAVPALSRLSLSRLGTLLEPREKPTTADPRRVNRVIRLVERAVALGRRPGRVNCRARGLALYYFLRREGVDVCLCYGLGKRDGEFVGHCWLEKNGAPYLETHDPQMQYTPFYRIRDNRKGRLETQPMR